MNITMIKNTAKFAVGRSGLLLKKYSPEILLGVGIVGGVVSTVMACKATLKVEFIIDTAKDAIDDIRVEEEENTIKDYNPKKEITKVYAKTGVKLLTLYGPALSLGLASYSCIVGSHGIMRRRSVAMIGAYKLLEQGFKDYRKRIIDEYGEEKDYQYKHGIHEETITTTETGEDGKKKKIKSTIQVADPDKESVYARFFDAASKNWDKDPAYNLAFLKCQQAYFNQRLQAKGHVFLNEIYDVLDIPRSQAGQFVGWVMGKDGDNFIDFGLFELENEDKRRFVNGYENVILLDFNVDGVIYDLI